MVGLAEARRRALANRRLTERGIDPRGLVGVPTLAQATDAVIVLSRPNWKPGGRAETAWRNAFRAYLYPTLGDKRIDKITTADLLAVVGPLTAEKPSVPKALVQRLNQVMRWAQAQGHRADNPAEPLAAVLPKPKSNGKHHRAIPHAEVAEALRLIDGSGSGPGVKLLIRFIALTATRGAEARLADWSEIDLAAALWTIPGERMKGRREHRVPLSPAALAVLAEAQALSGSGGLVFPGRGGGPIGPTTPATVFRDLGLGGTVHGLRSSFCDWAGESGVDRVVSQACIAHRVGSAVELAYARSDLLDRRRVVMDAWAEYLTG